EDDDEALERKPAICGQVLPAYENVAGFGGQAPALAIGAFRIAAVFRQHDPHMQLVLLRLQPVEQSLDAIKSVMAFDYGALLLDCQFGERLVHRDAFAAGGPLLFLPPPLPSF